MLQYSRFRVEVNDEGDDISGTGGIFWAESYRDIAQHRNNSYRVRNMDGGVLLVLEGVPEGIRSNFGEFFHDPPLCSPVGDGIAGEVPKPPSSLRLGPLLIPLLFPRGEMYSWGGSQTPVLA